MSAAKLTRPRRQGLAVLLDWSPACVRRSNVTDLGAGYVYWQTADWLVAQGYAYFPSGSDHLMLTPDGAALAMELRGS